MLQGREEMDYKDLRKFLALLEERGLLKHVKKEVDKDWELACIARWVCQSFEGDQSFGLIFDNVKGFRVPVVTQVFGSREMYALALGTTPDNIYEKWISAYQNPIKPVEVREGPVKEVIKTGDEVNLDEIPVPISTPGKDRGPFFSAPNVITKDPDTGIQNVGCYRLMVMDERRITFSSVRPYQGGGTHYYVKYEPRNEPMPIAIAIGPDPTISLTSVAKLPQDMDEVDVAGALSGHPVEVVQAETVDLKVPAHAEYVIEGVVLPQERVPEGPFGEFAGYMSPEGMRPYLEVKCITHRKDPIFQTYMSQMPPSESNEIRRQPWGAMLYKELVYDARERGIRDVHFPKSGGGLIHGIVQMTPLYPGHSKKVGILALGLLDPSTIKMITIVDEDIDIRDPFSVDWAVSFRVNPEKDIIIIKDCLGLPVDHSSTSVMGSKVIIDATMKHGYPDISLPSREYMEKVLAAWGETGLPDIAVKKRTRLLLEERIPRKFVLRYE
jgi:UbiD family decarboxylase